MPASSASSAPSEASAAPMRTTGARGPAPAACTAVVSGATAAASRSGPAASSAATPTTRYTATVISRAMGMARGMVRRGSRTSSPMVAMRAYPANAKNSSPVACRMP
jgi:hypothetical protein